MINQQAIKQLRAQAQRQTFKFEIERCPELWQWALAFLGQAAQTQVGKRAAPGLLAVRISQFDDVNWLELPAEWHGPHFIRLHYLAGPGRYLAWEIHLQPQTLIFQQITHLSTQYMPAANLKFTQMKQALTRYLAQIKAALKDLEQLKQQNSSAIQDYLPPLLAIWGGIEVQQLANQTRQPMAKVLELILPEIYLQKLTPCWFTYAPGEPRQHKLSEWPEQLDVYRWQSKQPLLPSQIYVCFLARPDSQHFILPLAKNQQQFLLLPRQSCTSNANQSLHWQVPAFNAQKTSRLISETREQPIEINLSRLQTGAKGPDISPETRWSHQEKYPLSLSLGNWTNKLASASQLIKHQNAWPILQAIWPGHKLALKQVLLISVFTPKQLPLAWFNQINLACRHEGGAIIEQSAQGALILVPDLSISWLQGLAQTLMFLNQSLTSPMPYQILIHQGDVDIYLHEQRFRLVGASLRFISEMLQKLEPDSGILASANTLCDHRVQEALHQTGWKLFDYGSLREQALILLQAPMKQGV